MRKWIIAGAVLLILIVTAVVALLNVNRLLNRNRDYLLARVKQAVGREIAIGDIGVTLWGGIGVRLKDFSVAEDPTFAKQPFVRADDLQVNVKFLPLLRKQFEVSRIILHHPVINVIKNEKGQFNFSSLGREKEKEKKEPEKEKKEPSEKGTGRQGFVVSLVNIDGGQIEYLDKGQGIDFRANQVDLKLNDISFDHPIDVDLAAAILGAEKQNLKVKARVGPLGPQAEAKNVPVEGNVELDSVPLGSLEKTLPALKQRYPQGLQLAGAVGAKTHFSGNVGKDALPQVDGTLNLVGVSARIPQLPQPITDVNTKVNFTGKTAELPESAFRIGKSQIRLAAKVASFTPLSLSYRLSSPELNLADLRAPSGERKKPEVLKNLASDGTVGLKNGALSYRGNVNSRSGTIFDGDYTGLQTVMSFVGRVATIESLQVNAFNGSLTAKGNYDMREATPRFAATTNVKGMDLTQILQATTRSAHNIRGSINMDLDVTGSGKDWNTIQKAMKGQGKAEVINGALVDVNLAESVLSGATGVTNAVNFVPADVRNKYPSIFNSKDTEFKQLKGSATISDGKARTDDLVISAAEFETQGKGWFAFDQTVDFRAMLLLSEKLSQDIMSRARETKGLANNEGRLAIPFDLSGKLPGAKPKPDVGYIAQALGKGALQRGLEGLFGRKSSKDTSSDQGQKPSDSQDKKKSRPQDEILRGLQQFFGK